MTASRAPVLFVADGDLQARDVLESALIHRFGADYRVVTAGTAADGLHALRHLVQDGDDVAIVAADVHRPEMDAVEFLQRACALASEGLGRTFKEVGAQRGVVRPWGR